MTGGKQPAFVEPLSQGTLHLCKATWGSSKKTLRWLTANPWKKHKVNHDTITILRTCCNYHDFHNPSICRILRRFQDRKNVFREAFETAMASFFGCPRLKLIMESELDLAGSGRFFIMLKKPISMNLDLSNGSLMVV